MRSLIVSVLTTAVLFTSPALQAAPMCADVWQIDTALSQSETAWQVLRIPLADPAAEFAAPLDPLAKLTPTRATVRASRRFAYRNLRAVLGETTASGAPRAALVKALVPGVIHNFALTSRGLMLRPVGHSAVAQQASKHLLLAGDDETYMTGEMWADERDRIHLNNDSGSFGPDVSRLTSAANFLRRELGPGEILTHAYGDDSGSTMLVEADALGLTGGLAGRSLALKRSSLSRNNEVFLGSDEEGHVLAVVKNDSVTKLLNRVLNNWDLLRAQRAMEEGGLQRRSLVAWDVARLLRLEIAPETRGGVIERGGKTEPGSAQAFLTGYEVGDKANRAWVAKVSRADAQAMFLLDALWGMTDRHNRNWMVNAEGDLKIIDTDHILYLTPNTRWYHSAAIDESLPVARGAVDATLGAKFLAVTPESLEATLRSRQIPEPAIRYAVLRLRGIQNAIRAGLPLEEIVEQYRIAARIGYREAVLLSGVMAALLWELECHSGAKLPVCL